MATLSKENFVWHGIFCANLTRKKTHIYVCVYQIPVSLQANIASASQAMHVTILFINKKQVGSRQRQVAFFLAIYSI